MMALLIHVDIFLFFIFSQQESQRSGSTACRIYLYGWMYLFSGLCGFQLPEQSCNLLLLDQVYL